MKNSTTKIINNSLDTIIEGINIASDIVISTLGGSGKNVILSNTEDLKFTKDGVSVAKEIKFSNPEENIGASLLIDAATKTVDQCGDGTTTTILFIKSLVNSIYSHEIEDKNKFIEDLDMFVEEFERIINEQAIQVDNIDDIYRIAITSCKSATIANLIKEIYSKTGFNANVTLEKSRVSDRTYYDLVEGLHFESGMVNSRFANQENNTCVLENVVFLLEDELVSSPQLYDKILGTALAEDRAIVIMAPGFSEIFIKHAVMNKQEGGLKICLIKSPGYGGYTKENYKDILAFSTDNQFSKIIVSQHDFIILNKPQLTKINKRVSQLQKLADNAVEDYDEKDYLNRIHRLKQTGAVIYVGGVTDKNIKEEYDRIEDALGAVTTALRSGYVRGAGVELNQIIPFFKNSPIYDLIKDILSRPYLQILQNANITRNLKTDIPFNVKTKTYDENIIDAADVLINSLKNAVSLFKLLINTSYVVHNE